jgi:hypothetical protein
MDTNNNPFIYLYKSKLKLVTISDSLQDQLNNYYRQGNLINTMNIIRQNFQSFPQLHMMNLMTSPMAESKIMTDQQNFNECTKLLGHSKFIFYF